MSENVNIAPGTAGGRHVSGAPATTENIRTASPDLLRNAIDRRIVKVRPMSTPVDQLTRCAASRHATAMTVEYYSVDTKQTQATLLEASTNNGKDRGDGFVSAILKTSADTIFDVSETVLVPSVAGTASEGGVTVPLMLYVVSRPSDGGVEVVALNGPSRTTIDQVLHEVPLLQQGTALVRMGRAATELDVQTAQFSAMPRKASNNCQIFKMQVEESTMRSLPERKPGGRSPTRRRPQL